MPASTNEHPPVSSFAVSDAAVHSESFTTTNKPTTLTTPDELCVRSLWDCAYEALCAEKATLVQLYEQATTH